MCLENSQIRSALATQCILSKIFFKIDHLVAEDPKSNTSLTGIALSRNATALLYSYYSSSWSFCSTSHASCPNPILLFYQKILQLYESFVKKHRKSPSQYGPDWYWSSITLRAEHLLLYESLLCSDRPSPGFQTPAKIGNFWPPFLIVQLIFCLAIIILLHSICRMYCKASIFDHQIFERLWKVF